MFTDDATDCSTFFLTEGNAFTHPRALGGDWRGVCGTPGRVSLPDYPLKPSGVPARPLKWRGPWDRMAFTTTPAGGKALPYFGRASSLVF